MPYELQLEKFTGPLPKLLELIEARKLQINEVSLARVTDDFLRYLETLTGTAQSPACPAPEGRPRENLRLMADFIAVASRLILIKSKSLLPDLSLTAEEESEIRDLEGRLKMYRELKPAMNYLVDFWRSSGEEFSRPYFLNLEVLQAARRARPGFVEQNFGGQAGESGEAFFYPSRKLTMLVLAGAIRKIFDEFAEIELESRTIKEKIVTLEEKISEIVSRLETQSEMNFKNAVAKKSVSEMVVVFLAILHLAREQLISLEQERNFSDIIVRKSR